MGGTILSAGTTPVVKPAAPVVTPTTPDPGLRTGHGWNPRDRFQTDPFTAIHMNESQITSTNVGLRNFFKDNPIQHQSRVFRGTMQPAKPNTLPTSGNVSLYQYTWKDGKELLTVKNNATFEDLAKVAKGTIQNDFKLQYSVHQFDGPGGRKAINLGATTFHDYQGRVIASVDPFKAVEGGGFWARLKQTLVENGAKVAKKGVHL